MRGPGAPDRRPARRGALLALLEERGLDALVVSHLANTRYLTGFTGSSGLLLVTPADTHLLSDSRYRTQAAEEVGGVAEVEIGERDLWKRLGELLGGFPDIERLGYEGHTVTSVEAERLRATAGPRSVADAGEVVEALRLIKDEGEVAAIRAAAAVACGAFHAVLGAVRPGRRELDVAADLEGELRRRGSEWHPFPTIVASGPRAALPHAGTTQREIARGELLLLDFGATVDGYCADLTRTVVVGARADERQRTMYALVRDAQQRAIAGLRGGMLGREGDRLARSVIEARGFGEAFGHSLGHGLGLEVHEAPRVSVANEDRLPTGAVVTVEPGVYVPGWGGIRIEDDVLLTDDGTEVLSDGQTALIEIV